MARQLRPRVLAVGFGIYFAVIAIASWQFAQSLPGPWYDAPITRWVYTTYMLVAAIFLVGLAGLGLSIRASFSRQLREVDTTLGSAVRQSSREALPPPLAETQSNTRDTVDRDIDEFLGRYLIGPGLVAGFILGLSGMMLPGADGFAQTNHHLNTALILGIGYSWVGVGWYVALTVYGLVGGAGAPRRR